jgi:hypothetical protein
VKILRGYYIIKINKTTSKKAYSKQHKPKTKAENTSNILKPLVSTRGRQHNYPPTSNIYSKTSHLYGCDVLKR